MSYRLNTHVKPLIWVEAGSRFVALFATHILCASLRAAGSGGSRPLTVEDRAAQTRNNGVPLSCTQTFPSLVRHMLLRYMIKAKSQFKSPCAQLLHGFLAALGYQAESAKA